MLTNQAVVPAFTSLIRWQNHRYVLRQSLSFYQNDFAGRIANKVMQAGLALRRAVRDLINAAWHGAASVVSTLPSLPENGLRMAIPQVVWLAAHALVQPYRPPSVKAPAAGAP